MKVVYKKSTGDMLFIISLFTKEGIESHLSSVSREQFIAIAETWLDAGPELSFEGEKKISFARNCVEWGKLTDKEYREFLMFPVPRDASNVHVIEDDSLVPTDRCFRDSWFFDGNQVKHDMEKALQIHLTRIRAVRDIHLKTLDGEYFKALEENDTAELYKIKAIKENLRDIPQRFSPGQYATAEQLKASWPIELEKPKEYL